MGSGGKSDAICWRLTSPAKPARLLEREEQDHCMQHVHENFPIFFQETSHDPLLP